MNEGDNERKRIDAIEHTTREQSRAQEVFDEQLAPYREKYAETTSDHAASPENHFHRRVDLAQCFDEHVTYDIGRHAQIDAVDLS